MAPIIKTKKIVNNALLSRRQISLEIIHPGQASVSKKEVCEILAKRYKTQESLVVPYGIACHFGGERSTGFVFIYDNVEYKLKYEPKFRLRRAEVLPKAMAKRKGYKELKRKLKRNRSGEKRKIQKQRKVETRQQVIKAKSDYLKSLGL